MESQNINTLLSAKEIEELFAFHAPTHQPKLKITIKIMRKLKKTLKVARPKFSSTL